MSKLIFYNINITFYEIKGIVRLKIFVFSLLLINVVILIHLFHTMGLENIRKKEFHVNSYSLVVMQLVDSLQVNSSNCKILKARKVK